MIRYAVMIPEIDYLFAVCRTRTEAEGKAARYPEASVVEIALRVIEEPPAPAPKGNVLPSRKKKVAA